MERQRNGGLTQLREGFYMEKQMEDSEYQLITLRRIFEEARFAPIFKYNKKFNMQDGYISFNDVMEWKFTIRVISPEREWGNLFASEETEVIAQYETMEQLIADGWRLD